MQTRGCGALARMILTLTILAFATAPALAQKSAGKSAKPAAFDASACYGCHAPIKAFHAEGKHKGVACSKCHDGIDKHLADATARPATRVDPAACGSCHQKQFETMYTMNWAKNARSEKSQATGPSPNPAWDKLMMPHGFTKEHPVERWYRDLRAIGVGEGIVLI